MVLSCLTDGRRVLATTRWPTAGHAPSGDGWHRTIASGSLNPRPREPLRHACIAWHPDQRSASARIRAAAMHDRCGSACRHQEGEEADIDRREHERDVDSAHEHRKARRPTGDRRAAEHEVEREGLPTGKGEGGHRARLGPDEAMAGSVRLGAEEPARIGLRGQIVGAMIDHQSRGGERQPDEDCQRAQSTGEPPTGPQGDRQRYRPFPRRHAPSLPGRQQLSRDVGALAMGRMPQSPRCPIGVRPRVSCPYNVSDETVPW